MIHALHLVWIVPFCLGLGLFIGLIIMTKDLEDEEY